jgi:hypothetical protein
MEPEDESYDDLLARIQAAGARVAPGPTAGERVHGALVRRRRRRRARVGLASVTAVAAVTVTGVVVVPGLLGDDAPVAPADEVSAPAIIEGGGYRPAGFFKDVVGGTAVPSITRYYRTVGKVVFTARFEWSPDPAGEAYLADLSLERYRSDAEQRCERLVRDDGTCDVLEDGSVLATYEVPADGAFLAPIGQEGRLRLDGSAGVLRAATYFRTDAKAVTALVCNCSSLGGEVLSEAPRVSFEALAAVVTDPSWALRVGS